MKRCHENPFTSFPSDALASIPFDAFGYLHQYLTPESRKALSQVDKFRFGQCSLSAESICFLPPADSSNPPEKIYQVLLARYPNIQKLTFESSRTGYNTKNVKEICDLIEFLNANKKLHPLSHVRQMEIQEIECDPPLDFQNPLHRSVHRDLNSRFLSSISHSKLESIVWKKLNYYQSNHHPTLITFHEIQPILEEAVELRCFTIKEGLISGRIKNFNLSFIKQSKLISARVGFCPDETISSLSKCKNLETLEVACDFSNTQITSLSSYYWGLKRFELSFLGGNLEFTKQMPHLEALTLFNRTLSEQSQLEDLGKNCHKLRELHISDSKLSEEGIARLLKGLSNLEVFKLTGYSQITTNIMNIIKENCPKINASFSKEFPQNWTEWTFFSNLNGI